jgi:hypothetical protein
MTDGPWGEPPPDEPETPARPAAVSISHCNITMKSEPSAVSPELCSAIEALADAARANADAITAAAQMLPNSAPKNVTGIMVGHHGNGQPAPEIE